MKVWRIYTSFLQKYPVWGQIVTTGTLNGMGDVIAQQVVERRGSDHNIMRTLRMTTIGFCLTGPALVVWYRFLDRIIKPPLKHIPLRKLLCDQTVFSPCILATIFTTASLLEGKNFAQIQRKFQRDYLSALGNSYKFWPAAQIITFYFMPTQFRVPYVGVASLFWNTYLAWITNKSINHG
ncbi:Protein Mpv17 [Trichoplax sp. H2]|nr:Protein Mpv17 [Trichoplax sp. H2]|eukprot:RDD42352.1 Protein Mpv17 [Trichoplax sp. H2]